MKVLKVSFFRKIALIVFFYLVALFALAFFVFEFNALSLLLFAVIFFISFLWLMKRVFFDPLKAILFEMQALLAGKNYKRIFTKRIDEVGVLATFFNKMTKSFSEVSFDIKDRKRILEELTVATQLQRDILPNTNPEVEGFDIVAKTKPASELGGDSYNFLTVKDKTFLYIGDVTGHGAAAGLIMTMVNSLITVFTEQYDSAYDVLVRVNKHIKKHVKKAMFMTLVMFLYDNNTKKLTYVGAGHEHILVYRKQSGDCEVILSGGVALGMVPDNSALIKEMPLELAVGDCVVLYSDGITESRNANDEMYGLDRLKKAVIEYAGQYSAEGINYHIALDNSAFVGDGKQRDDMTLIVMKKI